MARSTTFKVLLTTEVSLPEDGRSTRVELDEVNYTFS